MSVIVKIFFAQQHATFNQRALCHMVIRVIGLSHDLLYIAKIEVTLRLTAKLIVGESDRNLVCAFQRFDVTRLAQRVVKERRRNLPKHGLDQTPCVVVSTLLDLSEHIGVFHQQPHQAVAVRHGPRLRVNGAGFAFQFAGGIIISRQRLFLFLTTAQARIFYIVCISGRNLATHYPALHWLIA